MKKDVHHQNPNDFKGLAIMNGGCGIIDLQNGAKECTPQYVKPTANYFGAGLNSLTSYLDD